MTRLKDIDRDQMLRAYLEAAEWADDAVLDDAFIEDAEAVVFAFYKHFQKEIETGSFSLPIQWGHDLWLTRQGHGSGFWDASRQYDAGLSQRLTAYAEALGPCDFEQIEEV